MPIETLQSTAPGIKAAAVTAHDTNNITITRGIYVGTSGDVAVIMAGDSSSVIFKNLAAGIVHPLAVTRVLSTGTTATDIMAVR